MKTKKTTILIALGWTTCTAAAFWAGMSWSRDRADEAGRKGRAGLSTVTANGTVSGKSGVPGSGDSSAATAGGPVGRAKPVSDLTPEETAARMKDILAMEDPQAKMEAYLEFMKGLKGDVQIAAAMESLTENYSNRERGREFAMLMTRWAKESPEAALAWTQTHDDWRKQWGTQTALAVWAQNDPGKAAAWAMAHPPKNKDEGNYHIVGVISGIAKANPELASHLAENMDRSEARGQAMDKVLDSWFKLRGDEAAKTMVMGLEEGPYKNGILGRLAERLADKDPRTAALWAAALPAGEAKPRIVTEVIDEWADKNPNDAGTWLNSLPHDATMDEPRERFAWKVQEQNPEAALAWANTITDDKRRNEASYRLVRGWMEREPDVARAWVSSSQLPDDMKERLINRRRG